jgi:hypothetical protein
LDFQDTQEALTSEFTIFLYDNPEARRVWGAKEKFRDDHFPAAPGRPMWRDSILKKLASLDNAGLDNNETSDLGVADDA